MITRASPEAFAERLDYYRRRVDSKLAEILRADHEVPERLLDAMHYSVLGGGKRVRPLLVYASGELVGAAEETLDPIAAAVELIHAYSLVHDDLPAMDDDDLRRGRPTTHRQFDEATAIL
ncbi:MAG TPA: polyprenyl synthetase family protein, partial [Gammaproteobacteria bacterium]|nr:polyprenyl synthetase family protein [Gammaproteobacteria bacterium]